MNASVGGVSILNIVLIFIAFYFLFLIFVVRYVLVVRQKNYLINLIEEKEGLANGGDESDVMGKAKAPSDTKICKRSGNNGETYIVTMYIKFNMPLFSFNIPVKGQTRAIPVPLNRDIKSYNPGSCWGKIWMH